MLYLTPHPKDIAVLKSERRRFPRRFVRQPVVVTAPTGAFGGDILNSSASGVLLLLQTALPQGASVWLSFDRRTLVGNGRYPIRCLGTVVRVKPLPEGYSTAVTFRHVEMAPPGSRHGIDP